MHGRDLESRDLVDGDLRHRIVGASDKQKGENKNPRPPRPMKFWAYVACAGRSGSPIGRSKIKSHKTEAE